MDIGRTIGIIPVVYGALLIFGIAYNALYDWLERSGYAEGYLAFVVGCGCLVVIGGIALIAPQAALITLGAFIFAGTPMIVGSWWRHVRVRRAGQDNQRQEAFERAVEDMLP